MSSFERILAALKTEDEASLHWLLGQQSHNYVEKSEAKSAEKLASHLKVIAAYAKACVARGPRQVDKGTRILIFGNTANQVAVLHPIVAGLEKLNVPYHALGPSLSSVRKTFYWTTPKFGPEITAIAIRLLRHRWQHLRCRLDAISPNLRAQHLHEFVSIYIWAVFFDVVLSDAQPILALVSNDHSFPNRALCSLARVHGVKTAYVQHASVSARFPPLTFDYSFLDGSVSREIYRQLDSNTSIGKALNRPRHVFLTGVAKPLNHSATRKGTVGIAVNVNDNLSRVSEVCEMLLANDLLVRLRWHPASSTSVRTQLRKKCAETPQFQYSDPECETVGEFCAAINCLVAGNTSTHIEAAISGAVPIYFELNAYAVSDYYGYVERGVAFHADSISSLLGLVRAATEGAIQPSHRAIRKYSASFGTDAQGREPEVIAGILAKICEGVPEVGLPHYAGLIDEATH